MPDGNFSITLKLNGKYQWTEPNLMSKYEDGTHHKGYFIGGSNINLNIIHFWDNIVIL